jgi:GTP-binding GTPase Middle Region/50S ribosome-binding GTPase
MEIFHRHARSREAKLQVEIARLKYVSPRLRESLAGGERQQGSGAGESDLDLDRRKIRDRLAELKEQLEGIQRDNDQRRSARRDQLRVALVGYTNAGKSLLMRALTGSEVQVADKLFATLDTTVRALLATHATLRSSPNDWAARWPRSGLTPRVGIHPGANITCSLVHAYTGRAGAQEHESSSAPKDADGIGA